MKLGANRIGTEFSIKFFFPFVFEAIGDFFYPGRFFLFLQELQMTQLRDIVC